MVQNEIIINKATFNPKVKAYIYLVVLFYLIASVIGILIVPFWLLGLGNWLSNKFFHTLKCELSDKNLRFSKGLIIHIEKTIPLENIQDLAFIGEPVLRAFGLSLIRIETAGGGGEKHTNMMRMLGINNAEAFKMAILSQREIVVKEKFSGRSSGNSENDLQVALLTDIKQELKEIKNALNKPSKN